MSDSNSATREVSVLVANDHEWAARSLESILTAEGYRVIRAYNGRQALDSAVSNLPDAIVLDVQMPDLDGLEVCRLLRANPTIGATTPIFLTTAGPSGRAERLSAYRAGAWEFYGQPLDGEAILLKLATFLQSKATVDGLRVESLLDERTGLYNRRGLLRRGRELASEAARRGEALACVVFLPDAPVVNETVDEAERLAGKMSEVLRASGRSSDAIGRVGLVEFGLIAVGSGAPEAEKLIHRLSDVAARWQTGERNVPSLSLKGAYRVVDNAAEQPADPAEMLDAAAVAVHASVAVGARRAASR